MRIRLLFLLFSLFLLAPATAESVEFVSLEEAFRTYWTRSRGVNVEGQIQLWSQFVEQPNEKLYRSYFSDSEPGRTRALVKGLSKLESLGPRILHEFPRFEKQIDRHLEEFRNNFPSLGNDFTIFLLPSMSFNGKTVRIDGEQALLFGIDKIVEREEHLGVLFSHELFHIYHEQVWGFQDQKLATMTWPLWVEGLATYVSGKSYPEADIFMDPALLRLDDSEIPWLAEQFLEIVEVGRGSPNAQSTYVAWFNASPQKKFAEDLPDRLGYFLGYHVIHELSKSYSVETMARWSSEEAHQAMIFGLTRLARRKIR